MLTDLNILETLNLPDDYMHSFIMFNSCADFNASKRYELNALLYKPG